MSITKFLLDDNSAAATWMANGVAIEIINVKQEIFDHSRGIVAARLNLGTSLQLKIFDERGQAAEIPAPRDSVFQYLLPDNSKGVLIICSETSGVGTFDYKYELVLPEMRLKKIGRAY